MWGWQGWHGDDVEATPYALWSLCGPQGVGTMSMWSPGCRDHVGMMWGQQGQCRDNVGMTGMMQRPHRDQGGHQITKNAITLEQIEIIRFCLKIWDPWTLCTASFIRTICMHRIPWSCEGLMSVHNEYTGYLLKHLLSRHMYNLLLPVLLCYAQALRWDFLLLLLLLCVCMWVCECVWALTLYCVVLYILLV